MSTITAEWKFEPTIVAVLGYEAVFINTDLAMEFLSVVQDRFRELGADLSDDDFDLWEADIFYDTETALSDFKHVMKNYEDK